MESMESVVSKPASVSMVELAIQLMVLAHVRKVGEVVGVNRDLVWIPQTMGLGALWSALVTKTTPSCKSIKLLI